MASERDWPGDLAHENGNYQNTCVTCGDPFQGHKRRVTCKVCATPPMPDKTTQWRPVRDLPGYMQRHNKDGHLETSPVSEIPKVADKTPLELAHEMADEGFVYRAPLTYAGLMRRAQAIATALIERMTPVEVSGAAWVDCPSCKGFIWASGKPKFCHNCGVPITWE